MLKKTHTNHFEQHYKHHMQTLEDEESCSNNNTNLCHKNSTMSRTTKSRSDRFQIYHCVRFRHQDNYNSGLCSVTEGTSFGGTVSCYEKH